jgi:hypothetical protein
MCGMARKQNLKFPNGLQIAHRTLDGVHDAESIECWCSPHLSMWNGTGFYDVTREDVLKVRRRIKAIRRLSNRRSAPAHNGEAE